MTSKIRIVKCAECSADYIYEFNKDNRCPVCGSRKIIMTSKTKFGFHD